MKSPVPAAVSPWIVPLQLALSSLVAFSLAVAAGEQPASAAEGTATSPPADATDRAAVTDRLQFNRDIRPILSDRCYACHGPDSGSREADLRLDLRQAAIADRDGSPAIVPGQPAGSLLVQRIIAEDQHERMPPPGSGKPLTATQIQTLRRWIAEGAEYEDHWSFIAPRRPVPPSVEDMGRVNNPIDQFVLARLKPEGWQPSPRADRTTLIRRVSLDLTGQPPSLDEVDAFLADDRPGAFERVVDRLLASPRYGERMAVDWLDAARYADTHGYFSDEERPMWRWRD
ncbi:MAG: DUF1549 domain-containing protein, partial [Planctomycetaceae bacterium]|nr:DUF1549 domain-containing protein [Planctomycetaceae bacterium]